MAIYTVLTLTNRLTIPDKDALLKAIRLVDNTAGFSFIKDSNTLTVKTDNPLTIPQITAMQTAIDTVIPSTPQSKAQGNIDNWPIEYKALVLALIDQLNTIRAALPIPLGPITPSQALAAVRAKAGTL